MTPRVLERRLAEAREFEHTIGSLTFRLRIPTRTELRVIVIRHNGMGTPADAAAANADILAAALLSVRGDASTRNLGITGEAETLPETPEAARAFVSENLTEADMLIAVLSEKMTARSDAIEADKKN
jgi:hypothetical protein